MKEKIIKEWFERGERDFGAAKLLYTQKSYYDEI